MASEIKGLADRVERWLAKIPGIRTYRDREHRRETDKKLREGLADRLQEIRLHLKQQALELGRKNAFDPMLSEVDRLSAKIQQMADTIRYASYGYAGIFDLEKIREEELGQLCEFDLSLLDRLDQIHGIVKGMDPQKSPGEWRPALQETFGLLENLELQFRRRHDFLMRRPS